MNPSPSPSPGREPEPAASPHEFYDLDQTAPIAYRADCTTRNQARMLIARDWDLGYTQVRIRKTYVRWEQALVDEWMADGAEQPYDGWSAWMECGPGQEGVAYWTSGAWSEPEVYLRKVAHV